MDRLDRLRGLLRANVLAPPSPAPITLTPIGTVRSRLRDLRPRDAHNQTAVLELRDLHAPALEGLTGFSHAIVLTWLDRVTEQERSTLRERPGGVSSLPEIGVLALRTHHRPNPIAITVVTVESIDGARVHVRGLDAIDGTPILDIKPYLPPYDSVPDARMPAWAMGAAE